MTKYEDILASLIKKIKEAKKGAKVISGDVSKGIERPSFKIKIDRIDLENFMNKFQDRSVKVKIYYFPEDPDKSQMELLATMDELSKGFVENRYIQLEDGLIIELEDQNMFVSEDKVLHFEFKVFVSEEYEQEEKELMEDLEIGGDYVNKQ